MRLGIWWSLSCLILVVGPGTPEFAHAQHGIQYDAIAEPFLFLLRESAVWDDLKLSPQQRQQLVQSNGRHDGRLLAMRLKPNEVADREMAEVMSQTKTDLESVLTKSQWDRLRQIQMRIRGIECLELPAVADALQLSESQRSRMAEIGKETREKIEKLREQARSGQPREPLEKELVRLRTEEQRQMLKELTNGQKGQLTSLVGPTFDVNRLGKVRFLAPEISGGGEWINSGPLEMAQLKGKVVVVHFWTFG